MIRADQSAENRTALYPEGEEHAEDTVEQFPQIVDWIPMLERGKEAEFSAQMEELFEVLELNKITGRKELRESIWDCGTVLRPHPEGILWKAF